MTSSNIAIPPDRRSALFLMPDGRRYLTLLSMSSILEAFQIS
jgi:hypothetical protein